MKTPSALLALLLIMPAAATAQGDACNYHRSDPVVAPAGPVTRDNWLDGEHLRVGLDAPLSFMPGIVMKSAARPAALAMAPNAISVERLTAIDPADGKTIPLAALLDGRLYADGIMVLRGEQIVLERFRAGFEPATPRALLQGTRPILAALLATASERGRLDRDSSIARPLADLAKQPNLRKTSLQRLLDGRTGLTWSADDKRLWLAATGWAPASPSGAAGVRAWLKARRGWPRDAALPVSEPGSPEGELMTWVLESASKQPVSQVMCESLLRTIGAEDEAYWLTDAAGTELADGLALSLRDFARLGLALLTVRTKPGANSAAPKWLVEALAAGVRGNDPPPEALNGVGKDAAWRYRFVSLPRSHQAAIVGPFGNSLLIDFDRKLVVALYASVPRDYSELALRSLRSLWATIEAAETASPK
jgi:CubicO group peptidase (beta-lactamase class C family)